MQFFHLPALLVTVGGTLLVVLMQFSLGGLRNAGTAFWRCLTGTLPTPADVLKQLRAWAILARREGLQALEMQSLDVRDSFLRHGLELITDESDADSFRSALELELQVMDQNHRSARRVFEVMATAAPAWGMIGSLVAMIQMLSSLSDARQIGSGLAVALMTTLYGILLANAFCIPIAGRMEIRHAEEMQVRQAMLEGMMALLQEYSPKLIEERLRAWVPPQLTSDSTDSSRAA